MSTLHQERNPPREEVEKYIKDIVGENGKVLLKVVHICLDRYFGVSVNFAKEIILDMLTEEELEFTSDRYLKIKKK